jgi:DNA primase
MSGRIPASFIDALLARVDIVDVIDARVPLTKAGHEYKACCPFHHEKTPSFTVSPGKQFYHCFGCGAHGSAIGFLMQHERLSFSEAVEALAAPLNLPVPYEGARGPARPQEPGLYEVLARAALWYQQQLSQAPQALNYLLRRGVDTTTAQRYGLGYAPPGWDNLPRDIAQDAALKCGLLIPREGGKPGSSGSYARFRDRLMFPIRDSRGRCIGFGGRTLGDDTPKYLNSPETPVFHKGRELYGLYEAKQAASALPRLLVVEGYMDVVALAQAGISECVATLGTATTADHLNRLYSLSPEVVFCFDGDRAGRQAAWRALEQALPVMRDGRLARFLFLPEGDDPDSYVRRVGAVEFRAGLQSALPLEEYFFNRLSDGLELDTAAGKARLAELARPHLKKLPEGVFRTLLEGLLAQRTGVSTQALKLETPVTPPRPPVRRSAPSAFQGKPVRHAIALLLHDPKLALLGADPEVLRTLPLPGARLLADLVASIRSTPDITPARLVERWRDTPEGGALERLAAWQPAANDLELDQEYTAIVGKLAASQDRPSGSLARNREAGTLSPRQLSPEEIENIRKKTNFRPGTRKPLPFSP